MSAFSLIVGKSIPFRGRGELISGENKIAVNQLGPKFSIILDL